MAPKDRTEQSGDGLELRECWCVKLPLESINEPHRSQCDGTYIDEMTAKEAQGQRLYVVCRVCGYEKPLGEECPECDFGVVVPAGPMEQETGHWPLRCSYRCGWTN